MPNTLAVVAAKKYCFSHGQVWCWYPFYNASYANPTMLNHNETFASHAWSEYWTNRTGPFTSSAIDGVAFPALPYVVNGSTAITDAAMAQSPVQFLPGGVDTTVLNGYATQHSMMTAALTDVTRAAYELINANDGVLTVATMRPFSRGTVTLTSPNPFVPPAIDPRYGSNPIDIQVLQAAMAFNQRLMYTETLSQMHPAQFYPPADATDEEIVDYIHTKWQTEYHPGGTCAMMPIELGGVVSPDLLVYGTQNLRVVDSSIMPMLPAAHLQAVVYGIAEKVGAILQPFLHEETAYSGVSQAADIIKAATVYHSTGAAEPLQSMQTLAPSPSTSQTSMLGPASNTSSGPSTSTSFVTVVYTQTVYAF